MINAKILNNAKYNQTKLFFQTTGVMPIMSEYTPQAKPIKSEPNTLRGGNKMSQPHLLHYPKYISQ